MFFYYSEFTIITNLIIIKINFYNICFSIVLSYKCIKKK